MRRPDITRYELVPVPEGFERGGPAPGAATYLWLDMVPNWTEVINAYIPYPIEAWPYDRVPNWQRLPEWRDYWQSEFDAAQKSRYSAQKGIVAMVHKLAQEGHRNIWADIMIDNEGASPAAFDAIDSLLSGRWDITELTEEYHSTEQQQLIREILGDA
jgi:hypothetical protein